MHYFKKKLTYVQKLTLAIKKRIETNRIILYLSKLKENGECFSVCAFN